MSSSATGSVTMTGAAVPPPSIRSTSAAAGRSVGWGASSCRQSCSRLAGTAGLNVLGASGCDRLLAASTSNIEPRNGNRPVIASYSIVPTAYQSEAGVSDPPVACSGAMYSTVPNHSPPVSAETPPTSNSSASPKSSTTTRPSLVTITLDGLRSQCRRPARCSVRSALASWRVAEVMRVNSLRGARGSRSMRRTGEGVGVGTPESRRVSALSSSLLLLAVSGGVPSCARAKARKSTPSTSSIVKNHWSPELMSSCNDARFGSARSASRRNSRLNR